MSTKHADTPPFQALEQEAYHAFLEWPVFLLRKIRQLEGHIAAAEENLKSPPRKSGLERGRVTR